MRSSCQALKQVSGNFNPKTFNLPKKLNTYIILHLGSKIQGLNTTKITASDSEICVNLGADM